MDKKRIPKRVENKIKEYVEILKADRLPISKVILFGSYAKGTQHRWSDVDVCIVSPKFKNSFKAIQYLWLKRIFDKDVTIEPVGFTPEDLKDEYSSLIHEIRTTGIEMKV